MKRSPLDTSFRHLPFVYLLVPLIAGILFEQGFPVLRLIPGVAALSVLIMTAVALLMMGKRWKPGRPLMVFCLAAGIFLSGALLTLLEDITQRNNWLGHHMEEAKSYWAEVIEAPETKPKTLKLTLSVRQARAGPRWTPASGKVFLYLYRQEDMPELSKGDFILFPNELSPIGNRGNPFEFDYASYLKKKGFYFQAFLSPDRVSVATGAGKHPGRLNRLRSELLGSVERNVPDTAAAALTRAMLLNDRSLLDNDLRQAYAATGIAHIIAISGMHVSLFFSIILLLLRWVQLPHFRWVKYLAGLPVIWLYVALTNFPPSAVRAAVMFSLVFLSLALHRNPNRLNFLAATGFLLLCFRPLWLFDVGVQLSFAAVASIFLFFRPVYQLWQPRYKVVKAVWATLSVGASVQVLVFPVVLYYFHQFPVWTLLANLPAAAFSLVMMSMGLLLFLLDALGMPCLWLGQVMGCITGAFHGFIFFFARHTPESMRRLYLSAPGFWTLMPAVALTAFFFLFKKPAYAFSGLASFCLFAGWLILEKHRALTQKRIVVYHTTGTTLIDYHYGVRCVCLAGPGDTFSRSLLRYVLLPARLGWGVRHVAEREDGFLLKRIGGKRILFLAQDNLKPQGEVFPVDYLIVSNRYPIRAKKWQEVFQPEVLIIDGSFPRGRAARWEAQLKAQGLRVHNTKADGAWTFP